MTALIKSPEEKAAAVGDGLIDIADFSRMDLRVAVVKEAATVDGADKLLHLTLDVGDGRLRSVFADIKQHYVSDALIGRGVVYLANLRPRKMRFGVSEGMVLAASKWRGCHFIVGCRWRSRRRQGELTEVLSTCA